MAADLQFNDAIQAEISATPLKFETKCESTMRAHLQTLSMSQNSFRDSIGLQEFLENKECRILLLVTKNTKEAAFRVYNIFQKFEAFRNRYCFCSYKDVEYLEKDVDVTHAPTSIIDVFVIDFEDVDDFPIANKLYDVILKGTHKKIISIGKKIRFSDFNVFEKELEEAKLSDLTDSCLESLLGQTIVSLNNKNLTLNDFLRGNSPEVLSSLIPFDVWNNYFTSSKQPEESMALNFENDHFNKVFLNLRKVKVLKDIKIDCFQNFLKNYETESEPIVGKSLEDVKFLISGMNENLVLQELGETYKDQIILNLSVNQYEGAKLFKDACLKNPTMLIFWLHMVDEGSSPKWISTFNPDLYVKMNFIIDGLVVDEDELINRDEKIFLISDDSATGKSTTLLNLASQIQTGWKFWINLDDKYNLNFHININLDNVITFLFQLNSKYDSKLARILLKYSLTNEDSLPIYIFFDAFHDGMSENEKQFIHFKIFRIFEFLKKETCAKIFVSSRDFRLRYEGEVKPIKLKEIKEEKQIEFFKKVIWSSRLSLIGYKKSEIESKLNLYARKLLENINNTIGKNILGNPLKLKIIIEILNPKKYHVLKPRAKTIQEVLTFNLYDLYSKFVELNLQI